MTRAKIDEMLKRGNLTTEEQRRVAQAIIASRRTRRITAVGAYTVGNLGLCLSLLNDTAKLID